MNTKQGLSPNLKEAEKAARKIQTLLPKLTESEKATLELLLDRKSLRGLEESMRDVKAGRIYTLGEVRKMF